MTVGVILPTSERIQRLDGFLAMGREESLRLGANVVQAEFFHVGGKNAKTLEALRAEIATRRADGALIKTTVRFRDSRMRITRLVEEASRISDQETSLRTAVVASRGVRRWWSNFKYHRAVRQTTSIQAQAKALVLEELRMLNKECPKIGMECADRSFRHLQPNEFHELLEAAERSREVWIFLFKPTDLLADKLESLGKIM